MDWSLVLLIMFAGLVLLMITGMPVAFSFFIINLAGFFLLKGVPGLEIVVNSIFTSVSSFTLLPIPLFILMGEVLFHSGVAPDIIDAIDKWLGRVPGRLSLLSVAAGVLIATLTGVSMASTAILGSTLIPEMEKRNYKKTMMMGPILGSGCLAVMIPPSSLGVLLGAIGEMSIAKVLLAIIGPGLLMAALYAIYILVRCILNPSLAPPYTVTFVPLSEKLLATAKYILPIGVIIFLVIGVMIAGIATPTEAAATGTLGVVVLAACYRKLSWSATKKSLMGTLRLTGMIFLILAASEAFSELMVFTGASKGLAQFIVGLAIPSILVFIVMQVVVLILGMFMAVLPIMMIVLPIFIPIICALGLDPVWFGAVFLVNAEVGTISPPFGLNLFVMKGVASPDTSTTDIWRSAIPFIILDLMAMALITIFPQIALWLPSRAA